MKKAEVKETKSSKSVPDYSNRDTIFEVKHNGVSIEWTANLVEALSVAKSAMGSVLYEINRQTGVKRCRA